MSAATGHNRQYDLVVFGATGFVGQLVCQYLRAQQQQETFRWAIAGRSPQKLQALAQTLGSENAALSYLVADATDEASLREMCGQTQVVISTVGPYALYGNGLVKICAETGTSYCDLTGEPQWIRRMIEQYSSQAAQSGAYIVHCCGFDSVPSDLGVYYLQQQAQQQWGRPCSEVKLRLLDARGGVSGGTLASGLNLIKEVLEDSNLQKQLESPYFLCPDSLQNPAQPQPLVPVQFDSDFQQWVTPFVMAAVNTRVVLRSNYLQKYAYGEAFQYEEGIVTADGPLGWLTAQGLKLGLDAAVVAAVIPPSRWLVEKWLLPAPGEGPSQEEQASGFYDLRLLGKCSENQSLTTKVTGDRDPGYGSTSKIVAQAGLCLAQDFAHKPLPGGFWTPASLMGDALISRLEQYAGVTFTAL